ncbi:MAG: hypothetical protein Q9191_002045 [Dirinaria sp. TL-2023a]
MATPGGLVDLSLFAESPTSDWRFTTSDVPSYHSNIDTGAHSRLPRRNDFYSQGYTSSRSPPDVFLPPRTHVNFDFPPGRDDHFGRGYYDPPEDPVIRPLPRSYELKPLPALPPKKLCKPRPVRTRNDASSRCILNRLKKTKSEECLRGRRCTLQQRRKASSTPQLTLTVVDSARETRRPAPEMVWLPDEQMWLVTDSRPREPNQSAPQYWAPPIHPEPSPSVYSLPEATPPLTPDGPQQRNPLIDEDGLSPIQSQFRSLIIDAERRSPLFQEAMQTIPDIDSTIETLMSQASDDGWPVYDPAMYETPIEDERDPVFAVSGVSLGFGPHTPESPFDEIEREWNSAVSVYSGRQGSGQEQQRQQQHSRDTSDQSYHSAVSSMGAFSKDEDPVDFYLEHDNSPPRPMWEGIAKTISTRTSSMQSWSPSSLSRGSSLSSRASRALPPNWPLPA